MNNNLMKYHDEMRSDGIILYFSGPVSQAVVESVASLMRCRMRSEEAGTGVVQRVFSVLVEQMQNIVRYSSERQGEGCGYPGDMAHGQVVVGREEDGRFFVSCGNKVLSRDCPVLSKTINRLQGMNKDELKSYYKERRKRSDCVTAKGAGLGFVEMARKAVAPLDYSILPVDESTSFFTMKVVTQ